MEDRGVPYDVREDEVGNPGLTHAGEISRPADTEVLLRDPETVGGLLHDGQARRGFLPLPSPVIRKQDDGRVPRPTRPRSWCSCDRPNRSACSTTIIVASGTSTPTSTTVVRRVAADRRP